MDITRLYKVKAYLACFNVGEVKNYEEMKMKRCGRFGGGRVKLEMQKTLCRVNLKGKSMPADDCFRDESYYVARFLIKGGLFHMNYSWSVTNYSTRQRSINVACFGHKQVVSIYQACLRKVVEHVTGVLYSTAGSKHERSDSSSFSSFPLSNGNMISIKTPHGQHA